MGDEEQSEKVYGLVQKDEGRIDKGLHRINRPIRRSSARTTTFRSKDQGTVFVVREITTVMISSCSEQLVYASVDGDNGGRKNVDGTSGVIRNRSVSIPLSEPPDQG